MSLVLDGTAGVTFPNSTQQSVAGLPLAGGTMTGPLTLGGLLDTASTGQIKFPASQNASSDANTLDDYEEGTWTPSVGGNTTYNSGRYGRYVKVGKMVTVQYQIPINTIGTGSTYQLQGLPFTSENISSVQTSCVSYFNALAVSRYWVGSYVENNATTMQFVSTTGLVTGVDNGTALFGNNTTIYGFATYMTNT